MLQRQRVQARQRVVQLPQNVDHEAVGQLRPLAFEERTQAAVLDVLHQLPPAAGVLPPGLERTTCGIGGPTA